MKRLAVILLIVLAFGVCVPPSFSIILADRGSAAIGTLDVCHSAMPALASDGDMPCLSSSPFLPHRTMTAKSQCIQNTFFNPLLLVLLDERPPKA